MRPAQRVRGVGFNCVVGRVATSLKWQGGHSRNAARKQAVVGEGGATPVLSL